MVRRRTVLVGAGTAMGAVGAVAAVGGTAAAPDRTVDGRALLTDPFLQVPTADGVSVCWFTEWAGTRHVTLVGDWVRDLDTATAGEYALGHRPAPSGGQVVSAETRRLSQLREDADSTVPGRTYDQVTERPVWRHESTVRGLSGPLPYRVVSVDGNAVTVSETYRLGPAADPGAAQLVLLTSDHQLHPMTPANLAKAYEVADGRLDAVLMNGDLVNVPDRASEWFDDAGGLAFFASMQGRGKSTLAGHTWRGAPILQSTPMYTAIGNHEVTGRRGRGLSLTKEFNDPWPRSAALAKYEKVKGEVNPGNDPEIKRRWLSDNTFNTTSYEQILTQPTSEPGGSRFYAVTIGNIRLITLYVTNIWRKPSLPAKGAGAFAEGEDIVPDPDEWGYGQHIFERIDRGSRQYRWLERELASEASRSARYRVVMFHNPVHGLGLNSAPAFTAPVQTTSRAGGRVAAVTYEYPFQYDALLGDVEPLLGRHGVQLVFNAHSHLWNRFRNDAGVHFLETSNVGNTYGAFPVGGPDERDLPGPDQGYHEKYVRQGDPGGLTSVVPTVAPVTGPDGRPQPFLASKTTTAFSLLDSSDGTVRSYRFDTTTPDGSAVLFDEFTLD